jgi:membrane protein
MPSKTLGWSPFDRSRWGRSRIVFAKLKALVSRVKQRTEGDSLDMVAAAITFYTTLALFPLVIVVVSIYGLLFSPAEVQSQIQALYHLLPSEARQVLSTQLFAVVERPTVGLSWGAVVALCATLWSASSGTSKLLELINLAYDDGEGRGFVRRRALALLLTVVFLGAGLVALAAVVGLPALLGLLGLEGVSRSLIVYGRWPLLALLAVVALSMLYRVAPQRKTPALRPVVYGALAATALWIGFSLLFSSYVANFASFADTYGAVSGVIVLMLWLFLSNLAIALGAELSAELEQSRNEPKEPDTLNTGGERLPPTGQDASSTADAAQNSNRVQPGTRVAFDSSHEERANTAS